MWYYVKNNIKEGPVSDAALGRLFNEKAIDSSTMVWTQGQKKWTKLGELKFHKILSAQPKSDSLKSLVKCTSIFRAMLFVFALFTCVCIVFLADRMNFMFEFIEGKISSGVALDVSALEFALTDKLLSLTLFVFFIILLVVGYRWIYTAAKNAKSIEKNFPYSAKNAALSFLVPFVNFIVPEKVMLAIIKSSLSGLNKNLSPLDICLVSLWWISNAIALVLIIMDCYAITEQGETDIVQARLIFSICTGAMVFVAVLFWIVLVSRIYSLQKKFFSNPRILRGKIFTSSIA